MPSFLNKVFGYKKHDDKDASRPSREASGDTLLDGKYEAISPVVSPTAIAFAEAQSSKDADREVGFSLFRPKSRGVSQKPSQKRPEAIPQLTLHLPGPKENLDSRALGVAFEADPDAQLVLDDAVIGAKRLNPLEALILIRACAQAITERGLETLGIMHPHWFSASHEVQRRLISLFIHSLAPQSRITTLSPTPTASVTAFENELHYTRSPHDVAAVLRWGLRHLSLENGHFGKDAAEWSWYNAFFNAERDASYPVQGFSQLLLPQLPTPHIELLISTLTLISSLASHAEINSISGSKLSKFLGLWLLAATRSEQSDDWDHFYARWERAGRILEHLFLARLRDESLAQRLPTRLQELIKYYPYNKGSPATEEDLLSRPRFTTQQYDALFVRIETVLTHSAEQPRQHPIQLVIDALQLPTANLTGNEYIELWNALKTAASERDPGSADGEGPQFSRIFADETLQLLSLIPADSGAPTSPILLATPISKVVSPKRSSSSLTKILERAVSKARGSNGSAAVSPTSPATPKITDWAQFSMSGFGETPATQPLSALFDQDDDIEVTQPQISRKSSRKRGKSRTRRRRSEDNDLSATPSTQQLSETEPVIVETKLASVHVIQIDEAFIDFWSDAIVDPISADWPTFVVCGLKVIPSVEKPIRWLVIEQIYSREEPQPPPRIPSPEAGARGRSPRPSFRSDISGFRLSNMFSSTRKRFSVFSKSATDLTTRKSMGKSPKVGELGEILAEEEPATPSIPNAAEGPNRVEETILATAVTNGTTSGEVQQLPESITAISESFTAGGLPAPADQTPTTAEAFEFKEPVIRAKAPSAEATPQNNHGDISANLDSIKLSEDVTSTEVISQTMSTPGDVVDGSLVIVGSPTAAETSAVLQETAGAQVSVETVAMVDGIGIERAVAEEGVPEPAVEEAQVLVQGNQQPDFVEPVEIPSVAVAEETAVPESVVLTEEISVSTAVETSESALLAAEPEPAAEPVVEESHVSVEVEEPWRESVAVAEPEPEALEIPAAQEEAGETDAQQSLDVSEIVEASREVAQEIEIATPAPETVTLVDETPSQETDANEPEPAPEPEQFEEQLSEAVVGESQVVIVAEPSLDGVSQPAEEPSVEAVPAVAVEPETVANETVEVQASVEAESSQEAVVEEPPVEAVPVVDASEPTEVAPAVIAEPEPVLDEVPEPVAEEVQVLVEDEASQDAVAQPAEEPSAPELEAVDDAPAAAAPAAEEVVEAAVVADVEGQPEPETSVPEPAALVEETSGPEVVVEESEPAEVAPAVAAELEPPAEEATPEPLIEEVAPEPVVEESPAPVEPEEPVPAEVPSTEPVPDVVAEDVVAAEEVEEPVLEVLVEVVEDAAPEAIEEVAAPEPAIDVVEPIVAESESIVEEETAPAVPEEAAAPEIVVEASEAPVASEPEPVEEEQTPVEAEEAVSPEVTVEASEPAVAAEPESSKDMAPESTAEEVATQDAPAAELVIEASEPLVTAEPELSEEKGSERLVEEQTPVETVEPSVESVPPVEASGQATSAPASEQHLAAEVVAVEPTAEPEPEVVSQEPEAAAEEPQQVAEDPEPTPSVEETTVVVEEDAAPETAPEIIEPAPAAHEPEPSEEQAPEPLVEEVEVTVEAQESSDSAPEVVSVEVALQEPESAVVPENLPMEEPVEVSEEMAVELVSEQVDAQPEAVPSEPEAAPLVEDEVEPKPIVEEPFAEDAAAVDETTPTPEAVEQTDAPQEAAADIPAEPSMPEVDVPTQEPPAPSGDAAAEDA